MSKANIGLPQGPPPLCSSLTAYQTGGLIARRERNRARTFPRGS